MLGYLVAAGAALPAGFAGALALSWRHLRWTWSLPLAALGLLALAAGGGPWAVWLTLASMLAGRWAFRRHRAALERGGDAARAEDSAIGPWDLLRQHTNGAAHNGSQAQDSFCLGHDDRGHPVWVRLGLAAARHFVILGATGSGKTTAMVNVLCAHIRAGLAVIVIDGKGSRPLRDRLAAQAATLGREFICWTPDGGARWNPLAGVSARDVADLMLATQRFSEPHYEALYRRYLHAVTRCLAETCAGAPTLRDVIALLEPDALVRAARDVVDAGKRAELLAYAEGLTPSQRRDLRGLADRFAVVLEAGPGEWLLPGGDGDATPEIDLDHVTSTGAVVYVGLDGLRFPDFARVLGTLMAGALQAYCGQVQAGRIARRPFMIAIDEFSLVSAEIVANLYELTREAAAGSMVLATQEMANLRKVAAGFMERILANYQCLIALRQNNPDSADFLARSAGTEDARNGRGREFLQGPDDFLRLANGHAVLIDKDPIRSVRLAVVDAGPAAEASPVQGAVTRSAPL